MLWNDALSEDAPLVHESVSFVNSTNRRKKFTSRAASRRKFQFSNFFPPFPQKNLEFSPTVFHRSHKPGKRGLEKCVWACAYFFPTFHLLDEKKICPEIVKPTGPCTSFKVDKGFFWQFSDILSWFYEPRHAIPPASQPLERKDGSTTVTACSTGTCPT